jgi:hypothetical protein
VSPGRGRDLGPRRPKLVPAAASIAKKAGGGGGGRSEESKRRRDATSARKYRARERAGEEQRPADVRYLLSQPPALGGPIPARSRNERTHGDETRCSLWDGRANRTAATHAQILLKVTPAVKRLRFLKNSRMLEMTHANLCASSFM